MVSATAMFPVLLAACGASDHDPHVLLPGRVSYLCSTGGYWRTQHGTLVVR